MIDAEFVQEISSLAQKSVELSFAEPPGERRGLYWVRKPDGTVEQVTATAPWHNETLATPAELATFVRTYADIKTAAVLVAPDAVVFVRNVDDRRDRATCPLILSEQFKWLRDGSKAQMSQNDMVRVLRILFRGCLPPDSGLLNLLRNLKFASASESAQELKQGRESLGRSITAACTGEGALPEDVTLNVPVFENHKAVRSVACALEVFPHELKLKLTPFPNELANAMEDALASVAEHFTDPKMPPVFFGQP